MHCIFRRIFSAVNQIMETIFLISLFIILYTYIGYALVLWLAGKMGPDANHSIPVNGELFSPSVTVIVAAYNEASCIEEKIKNSLSLEYPAGRLHFIFVTDGSDDGTPAIVSAYPQIELLHEKERHGKVRAIERAMEHVKTDVVVFTDANAMLNSSALLHICRHYRNKNTGAVAGEKRIDIGKLADATAGEGLYWKYESTLKKWESDWYSVVGAAGELFSIRTALYKPVAHDMLLDDLVISMQVALQGYRVHYEPAAYATEKGSASIAEELKRKTRIAAGGVQALFRLPASLLLFKRPRLSFSYLSHRVLRWVVTPYLLVIAFVLNLLLVRGNTQGNYLVGLLAMQGSFYGIALLGWLLERQLLKNRVVFIPYYFCLMNYAMMAGMWRYLFARQTVLWEKARRK
jgi:biofilm PGA synthesis N-glycosyltransferase PgaC